MWIVNFFRELKVWRIVRREYRKYKDEFWKAGIKSDWFGTLHVVINRDPDIELGSGEDEVYLRKETAELSQILIKHGLLDILAYELTPLEEEHDLGDGKIEFEHGYHIQFTPAYNLDRQYVTWKSVTFMFLLLAGIIAGIITGILYFV